MIVGTHLGLFMPALRPDWEKCLTSGQPELQVRSRRKVDLLNLRRFMAEHGQTLGEPFQIPRTDYQWRAYTTRYEWGIALADLAMDIDYTKFKDTPEKKHGDKKLTEAYGAIWGATLRSFPTGSIYSTPRHSRTSSSSYTQPRERIAETVYRTENREWRMKGASPKEIADLMREIDCATEGVELPSDEELAEMDHQIHNDLQRRSGPTEINGHLDHAHCTHSATTSARRKCRKRFYRDN